jgi:hypothetical protein
MAEWTSSRSYADRIANLLGVGSGATFANRNNGNIFLRTTGLPVTRTVFDDAALDLLTGGNGLDWFLADLSSPIKDVMIDRDSTETVTDIG